MPRNRLSRRETEQAMQGQVIDFERTYHAATSLPPYRRLVQPLRAGLCTERPFFPQTPRTAAEKRGVQYERKVQRELQARHGCQYLPSPWFWYQVGDGRTRYCQPDGLLIQPEHGLITIAEVKISHTEKAYYQTTNLYTPVVQWVFDSIWSSRVAPLPRW